MRAIVVRRYGGPDVLRVETIPRPEPKAGEVRIATAAAGVAFGDVLRRRGLGGARPVPLIPGYDVAGRIDAVGPGVDGWAIGARVAAYVEYGGYAEAVCVPAERLAAVPDAVDDTTAVSLVLNYGTAFQMIEHVAGLKAGQSVVVTSGAGGVGAAVLDLARASGITAVGLASNGKHGIVRRYGAAAVDYRRGDVVAEVRRALGGRGADAVLDGLGGGHLWRSRAMAGADGSVVLFGVAGMLGAGGRRKPSLAPTILASAGLRLLGRPRLRLYVSSAEQTSRGPRYAADVGRLMAMAAERRLEPLIQRRITLDEAPQAQRDLEAGAVTGKIVIAFA